MCIQYIEYVYKRWDGHITPKSILAFLNPRFFLYTGKVIKFRYKFLGIIHKTNKTRGEEDFLSMISSFFGGRGYE